MTQGSRDAAPAVPDGSDAGDRGWTHVALEVSDARASTRFYRRFAGLEEVHHRVDPDTGRHVVWLSDLRLPFVLVLVEVAGRPTAMAGTNHLGVAVSRERLDELAADAEETGCLVLPVEDHGPPVGRWCILADPDGHHLELSHGQDVAWAVAAKRAERSDGA